MPNNYPLHPNQTHIEPYYTQITTEEYKQLKKRCDKLRLDVIENLQDVQRLMSEKADLIKENKLLKQLNTKLQEQITILNNQNKE